MITYSDAVSTLGEKVRVKIDHNTFLIRLDPQTFAVRLHATDIVKIHDDGTFTLANGGWQTVTTKDRINKFSPVRIHQKNGTWFVGEAKFINGMKVG